jgi:hypothetical protein
MRRTVITLLVGLMLSSQMAAAAVSDADFAALRADLAALAQRFEALEAENARLKQQGQQTAAVAEDARSTAVAAQESGGGDWTDRVSMDGDFRYRFENIDVEGKDERNRSRIRARANVKASLPNNTEVGFGLATGGEDPVSANQTIGNGGSAKDIRLNLAYAKWSPVDGLSLIAGKFKNPLYRVAKNPLMWDGDWTPEGLALTYERDWLFLNALGSWLDSDSSGGNTNFSWGGQVGATGQVGELELKGGVGYYAIKTQGDTTYFGDPTDPGDFFGNTAVEVGTGLACGTNVGTTCVYLYDYLLTQVFGEAAFDLFGFPTVVFFDATRNSDASANDTSWALGTRIGKTKDRGQVQFSYWYSEKEADGVFGLLTDSDFAGGGTDNEGHFLKLAVGLNKQWSIGAQYFINEFNVSSGSATDYNRLVLDTQWKWK